MRKTKVRRHLPGFLFLQSVRVGASQPAQKASLAMIDVTGGGHREIKGIDSIFQIG